MSRDHKKVLMFFRCNCQKEKMDTYEDILVLEIKGISICKLVLHGPYFSRMNVHRKFIKNLGLYC
ncbi:hypothetical protein WN943_006814 [Citrus x changshan-huyou]